MGLSNNGRVSDGARMNGNGNELKPTIQHEKLKFHKLYYANATAGFTISHKTKLYKHINCRTPN